MMDTLPNILECFGEGAVRKGKRRLQKLLGRKEYRHLMAEIASKAPGIRQVDAIAEIVSQVDELLSTPVSSIMIKTWNESGVMKKYLDKSAYDPNAVHYVELLEHTIRSKQRPYLEITLAGTPLSKKIELDVDLTLTVEGIVLKIQDARIKEISLGKCKGSGRVSCAGLVLMEKKTGSLELPAKLDLGQGIPIAA